MVVIGGDAVSTAAGLVGTILVLNFFGGALALYPRAKRPGEERGLLKQNAIQSAATMASFIFLPCFIVVAVSQTEDIFSIWPLILWHFASIPLSMLLSWILARACRLPTDDAMPFVASCSWGNLAAVPLVFMQAACDQPELAGEPDCYERASAFIGISIVAWHFTFWTVGELLLTRGAGSEQRVTMSHMLSRLRHPNIIALLLGMVIAMVPDMSDVFFSVESVGADGLSTHSRPPLGFIASAAKTLGTAAVGLLNLVVAATLGKRIEKMTRPAWAVKASQLVRSGSAALNRNMSRLRRSGSLETGNRRRDNEDQHQERVDASTGTEVGSQPLGLMLPHELDSSTATEQVVVGDDTTHAGAVPQQVVVGDDTTHAGAAPQHPDPDASHVVVVDETEAGGARHGDEQGKSARVRSTSSCSAAEDDMHGSEDTSKHVSDKVLFDDFIDDVELSAPRTLAKGRIALMVFGRVIVVGIMQFMLVYLLGSRVFTGPDAPLVQFVLYIQAFTPTGNMAVVACQHAGNRNAAETIAVAMIFQWLVIGVVLVFSGAVALSLLYPT